MSKAKYEQAEPIRSIAQFAACDSLWYKWNGRTAHRSVLISLQYRTLENTILNGRLYVARLKDREKKSGTKMIDDKQQNKV